MIGLAPKLPFYWAFRAFGWPTVKPFSVVISVSFRCNSKCRTCDVWRKPNDDLTVAEWDKVFASLGRDRSSKIGKKFARAARIAPLAIRQTVVETTGFGRDPQLLVKSVAIDNHFTAIGQLYFQHIAHTHGFGIQPAVVQRGFDTINGSSDMPMR